MSIKPLSDYLLLDVLFAGIKTIKKGLWVNYLGYNQQRFIKYTMEGIVRVTEQLLAASTIKPQNRLILDIILAEEQGVCMSIEQ